MVENRRKSEFQEWLNSNDHLYLSNRGASFTWSNGRRCSCHSKKRLDKVVCNTYGLLIVRSLLIVALSLYLILIIILYYLIFNPMKSDMFPLSVT